MADALETVRTRPQGQTRTPQVIQADERQVLNSAGGYTFEVTGEARVHRFLTLGVEGGTYYTKALDLTKGNAQVVMDWAANRTQALVVKVVEVSEAGRAPRNQPALFALAAAISFGDVAGRQFAGEMLPRVARTGTHLFTFVKYVQQFRSWGPVVRKAVANWYLSTEPEALSYQIVKYRQREGWTHADVLRSAHPKPTSLEQNDLFKWVVGKTPDGTLPKWVLAYERAREIELKAQARFKTKRYVNLVTEFPGIPWEVLPDEAMKLPEVWDALLHAGVPQTALIRQLPRLTRLGLLAPLSSTLRLVTDQLSDAERLRKGRVHPVSLLVSLKVYANGRSEDGKSTWTPVPQVIDALDAAFYASFPAVQPAGKRTMLALDISGSMGSSAGGLPITCREVTAAVALVTAATEPQTGIYGFGHTFRELSISPRQRLDDVVRTISGLGFQRTDCSLPMEWARRNKVQVDTFAVYTDNETYYGDVHPHEALANYRQESGIPARQAVVSITPTRFSIADPDDPGTMDVSGFDSNVPALLADFSRGDI